MKYNNKEFKRIKAQIEQNEGIKASQGNEFMVNVVKKSHSKMTNEDLANLIIPRLDSLDAGMANLETKLDRVIKLNKLKYWMNV